MFEIKPDNKMILTKGDSATFKVTIMKNDGLPYTLQSGDVLTLKVKQTPTSATTAISKTADSTAQFAIEPSDTSSLTPGLYVYDVQLVSGSDVYTVIPMNYLDLMEEIN